MYHLVLKLDDMGRLAWITLMVIGFIVFWPIGLAILGFLIWSGRMGCGWHGTWSEDKRARYEAKMARMQERMARWGCKAQRAWAAPGGFAPSGNRAFDEYREETLRRLEDEAREFRSFLDRLRMAKDKAEFDQFMAERRTQPPTSVPPVPPTRTDNGPPVA